MVKNKKIVEDVPATTTNNAGTPLIDPQAPITQNGNMLRRYRKMKDESICKNNK